MIFLHKPWLLSNIIDTNTNQVPEYLKPFEVFERAGVRIGVIGLVEKYGSPHPTAETGRPLFFSFLN